MRSDLISSTFAEVVTLLQRNFAGVDTAVRREILQKSFHDGEPLFQRLDVGLRSARFQCERTGAPGGDAFGARKASCEHGRDASSLYGTRSPWRQLTAAASLPFPADVAWQDRLQSDTFHSEVQSLSFSAYKLDSVSPLVVPSLHIRSRAYLCYGCCAVVRLANRPGWLGRLPLRQHRSVDLTASLVPYFYSIVEWKAFRWCSR